MGQIINRDCLLWLAQRRKNSVDHIIMDMPYGHAKFGDHFRNPDEMQYWTTAWATDAYRICRPGAWLVTTMGSSQDHFAAVITGLREAGWSLHYPNIFWGHPQGYAPQTDLPNESQLGYYPNRDVDPIIIASKGRAKSYIKRLRVLSRAPGTVIISGGMNLGSYYRFDEWQPFPFLNIPKASQDEMDYGLASLPIITIYTSGSYYIAPRHNPHASVKPIKLFCLLLKLFTEPDQIVVDPFAGSGTTIIACDMLARRGIGIEVEAKYAAAAQMRIDAWAELLDQSGVTARMKRSA